MGRTVAAVVGLLLCACSPEREPLMLDPVGSPGFVAAVHEAADEWTSVCDVTITWGTGGTPVTEALAVTPGRTGETTGTRHSDGHVTGTRIVVLESLDADLRRSVLAHEIGHALGLRHTATGIMYADQAYRTVSPSDCP